jgi:SAM-dependent methyltransferase
MAEPLDFSALEDLSAAFCEARVLHAAVGLDLFTAVGDGADAAEVADARGLDPRATGLLLNAMTALGLLHKTAGRYTLTPAARRHLLPGSAAYLGGMVAFESATWDLWGRLEEAVRTGEPVRPPDMYQGNPHETRRFILAMDSLVRARGDAAWLAGNLDLSGVRRVLDVGSGPATYPVALCRAHPELRCTVFDLPGTLAVTRERVREEGLDERIALVAGDYHADPLPEGFDLVFLSNVIHGEDEAANRDLMAQCFAALKAGGRVVVKDHVLAEDLASPAGGAVFSLLMLLSTRGRNYAFGEIAGWMTKAGFEAPTETVLPPPFSSSLVVARRP